MISVASTAMLADYLGQETTEALIRELGGRDIVVPVMPRGVTWRRLVAAIGESIAHEMIRHFRGEKLYIPLGRATLVQAKREWVLQQRAAGKSIEEIAEEAVFCQRHTRRWVRRVIARAKQEAREQEVRKRA